VDDLAELVAAQVSDPERWDGQVVNVGGGRERSLSLLEATRLCRELTGREVPISAEPSERPGDVPLYVSDCSRLFAVTDWRPRRSASETLAETSAWIEDNLEPLERALGLARRDTG
jgi:CDP-paratose 2-epimerase